MKTNELCRGQIVKNYKEMCALVGEEVKTGTSKKAQIKEWERHILFHKDGQRFIIDEIYETEKVKVDGRYNGKYADDIQKLILNLIVQADGKSVLLSTSQLFKNLSMTNINYSVGRRNIPKLSELTEVAEEDCYEFYNYTQTTLKKRAETSLNRLASKSLIFWNNSITIVKREAELNKLGEVKLNVNGSVKFREVHREATENEKKMILACEREVMLKNGWRDKQDIFLRGEWGKFKKLVNAMLTEYANIVYYYDSYKITYNSEHVEDYLYKLEEEELKLISSNLNDNIMKMISENAVSSHTKAIAKEESGDKMAKRDWVRCGRNYIVNSEVLSEVVIDKDAKDITDKLKQGKKKTDYKDLDTINGDLPF